MSLLELINEFKNLGCTDEKQCSIASRIFFDLANVVRADDLEKHYDHELNFIYIFGRHNNTNKLYLPFASTTGINFLNIQKVENKFCETDKNIILSICDPNGTILYYKVQGDWIEN